MSIDNVITRSSQDDGPESVLREGRQRFIAGFPKRCDSMELLLKAMVAQGPRGLTAPLRDVVHQIAGMAGTVGFPAVSQRASELEVLATHTEHGFDLSVAGALLEQLHDAFAQDIATPPDWAFNSQSTPLAAGQRIFVVDDADDQRETVSGLLRGAGYDPVPIATGDTVVTLAKEQQPAMILLDANLPGIDGYTVCRLLKSDPDLASIPVIFMTVRSSLDDKLAGLTLGADEYLVKPLHFPELLLRIDLRLKRARVARSASESQPSKQGQLLSYDVFMRVGRELLKASAATFALVRVPEPHADEAIGVLRSHVRSRDIVSRYDQNHVVMLLEGAPPALVRHRLAEQVEAMKARGVRGVWAGIAFSTGAGEKPIEVLLAEGDDALTEARYLGESAALKSDHPRTGAPATTISMVLAEDDPEVVRIIESQFRSAGYKMIVAADGEAAMEAVRANSPDVLLLALSLRKLSGFDVLAQLKTWQVRPRIVVLSVREHEEDVARAFELGADDYITKPFSPRELTARVARLLR
jgi:DNA-binding response OmpR family regulator